MKNSLLRAWRSVWTWRALFVASLLFIYFGDPLPVPNITDPDFGHGNSGVRDGQVFVDVNEALQLSTNLRERFVMDEKTINIGVYNTPHFVLTVTDRDDQLRGLTGTGPSFRVSNPYRSAQIFADSLRRKGYTAEVVAKFLPNHPDDFYLVLVRDPKYPPSDWRNKPLLGWDASFRVWAPAMGLPKFRSFADFAKIAPSMYPAQ